MFAGFEYTKIQTAGATIHVVTAGNGAPVLLLHGYPQTHVMWHKIAPLVLWRESSSQSRALPRSLTIRESGERSSKHICVRIPDTG